MCVCVRKLFVGKKKVQYTSRQADDYLTFVTGLFDGMPGVTVGIGVGLGEGAGDGAFVGLDVGPGVGTCRKVATREVL